MTSHTECCGEIEIRYFRSADGHVVHRAECTRRGRKSVGWHYAARMLGNDHGRVLAAVDSIPWLRACSYCMADAGGAL